MKNSFYIDITAGISCSGCFGKVKQRLDDIAKAKNISLKIEDNLVTRKVKINGPITADELITEFNKKHQYCNIGLQAQISEKDFAGFVPLEVKSLFIKAALGFVIGLPLFIFGFTDVFPPLTTTIGQIVATATSLLTLIVVAHIGKDTFKAAWQDIKNLAFGMETLIAFGAIGAWLFSFLMAIAPSIFMSEMLHPHFAASIIIVAISVIGKALKNYSQNQINEQKQNIIEKHWQNVAVKVTKEEEDFPAVNDETVNIKDIPFANFANHSQKSAPVLIKVKFGERVPLDGIIHYISCDQEEIEIEESIINGDENPVNKRVGDKVVSGSVNCSSYADFVIEVKKSYQDSTAYKLLQRLCDQIQGEDNDSKNYQRSKSLLDKISAWFVPLVMLAAITSAILWGVFGASPVTFAITSFLAILLSACPCVIGLAQPLATTIARNKGFNNGVLLNPERIFDSNHDIDTIVFDKTGTITYGRPRIINIKIIKNSEKENYRDTEILTLAASAEQNSRHPAAIALKNQAEEKKLVLKSAVIDEKKSDHKGIVATVDEKKITIGNKIFMQQHKINIANLPAIKPHQELLFMAIDEKLEAIFTLEDEIRPNSKKAITKLRQAGIKTIMLTGSSKQSAAFYGKEVNITEIHAEQTPESKEEFINNLKNKGKKVMMVGDGCNDIAAMKASDISIAIDKWTMAEAEADLTLRGDLRAIPNAIDLVKVTNTHVKQNIFWAFAYNFIAIALAAGVLYPATGMLLDPVIASLLMGLSSTFVILNSLRLYYTLNVVFGINRAISTMIKQWWQKLPKATTTFTISIGLSVACFLTGIICTIICGMDPTMAFEQIFNLNHPIHCTSGVCIVAGTFGFMFSLAGFYTHLAYKHLQQTDCKKYIARFLGSSTVSVFSNNNNYCYKSKADNNFNFGKSKKSH